MIVLSFGRWSSSSGSWFIRTRIYRKGRWTPFCRIRRRYTIQTVLRRLNDLEETLGGVA